MLSVIFWNLTGNYPLRNWACTIHYQQCRSSSRSKQIMIAQKKCVDEVAVVEVDIH